MARIAIATLQPVWDCRWSRPGHRLDGVAEALQPETRWVCVREGHRRNIGEEECATCSSWEMAEGAAAVPAAVTAAAGSGRALEAALRVVLGVTGGLFAVTGSVVLTGPAMIPVSIGLWLGMAVMVGLAAFGRFSDRVPLIPSSIH